MRFSKASGRVMGALALAALMAACQQESSRAELQPAPAEEVADPSHDSGSDSRHDAPAVEADVGHDARADAAWAQDEATELAHEHPDEGAVAPQAAADSEADTRPATPEDLLRALGTLNDALDGMQHGQSGADGAVPAAAARIHDVWTDAQPPLSVEFQTRPLTADMLSYRIVMRSMADRLIVYDLRLNRGHCGVAELGEFKEGLRLPVALNFGQKKTVRVHRCDRVLEAVVDTQYGEYLFRWN